MTIVAVLLLLILLAMPNGFELLCALVALAFYLAVWGIIIGVIIVAMAAVLTSAL